MAQQGPPPPRSGRPPPGGRPGGGWYDDEYGGYDDDIEQYPPWAGPQSTRRAGGSGGRDRGRRRGQEGGIRAGRTAVAPGRRARSSPMGPGEPAGPARGRRAATRARRGARRARYVWGAALLVILVIAAGVGYELGHRPAPKPAVGGLVTTFQPGDFTTVPNACSAVRLATLNQYLPGTRRTVSPRSLYGSRQSLCDWTDDHPPLYRVLAVTVRAYGPSALATGNGSATQAAIDAYRTASHHLASPPKASHLPKAAMTTITGLGSAAFAGLQVPSAGGDITNLLTVVVRDHNVLITVVAQGPARSHRRYSAVSAAELRVAADAAARDIITRLRQPVPAGR